jgi:hypothetical protein
MALLAGMDLGLHQDFSITRSKTAPTSLPVCHNLRKSSGRVMMLDKS